MPRSTRNTGPLIDEQSALLSGSSSSQHKSSSKRTRAEKGVSCNRYFILILLVAMVMLSVRYQQEINSLQSEIQENQQSIDAIQTTLAFHEEVIERFNSSITNRDVIAQLSALQNSLNATSVYLQDQLARVQMEVSKQLDSTVKELSDTVTKAEQEISDEVEKVKKDVEHYVVSTQDQFSMENSFMVYQLAGTFTLLSCLISMWHLTAHLRKMEQPMVQRKILAILWMSPIYAVTSWFSLVFPQAEGYLAIIKDGYEAYIIYQFLSFCIAVIGRGDRDVVVDVLAQQADHLTPPFRLLGCFEICGWCKPEPYSDNRALANDILLQCQGFAMQFVLFRPLTTTVMVVMKNMNYYGAGVGPMDYRAPQFYITIVQNLSIFTAFTGLLKFYHAVDKELAWCRPLAKFLCIKGVVFMTFWQGLAISVLAQTTDVAGNDKDEWAKSAQNFLICLEMLLFSIAHFYCFPTDEWQEGYRIKHLGGQFGDTIALGDFFHDVKLILTSELKPSRRRKKSGVFGAPNRSIRQAEEIEGPSVSVVDKPIATKAASKAVLSPAPVSAVGKMERCDPIDIEQPSMVGPLYGATSGENDSGDDEDVEDGSYETDNDDSDGWSDEDLNDDQQFIKTALQRSLGIAGNDPDIIEATKRLLENNLLSPEFFNSDDELPASLYGSFHATSGRGKKDSSDDDDDESYDDDDDDGSDHGEESVEKYSPEFDNAGEAMRDVCSYEDIQVAGVERGNQDPEAQPVVSQDQIAQSVTRLGPETEPLAKQSPAVKQCPAEEPAAKGDFATEPVAKQGQTVNRATKQGPDEEKDGQAANHVAMQGHGVKVVGEHGSSTAAVAKQSLNAELIGIQSRFGIPVGEQARGSTTSIPTGIQGPTEIPKMQQTHTSMGGSANVLPGNVWLKSEIISSTISSANASKVPTEEDFQVVHEIKNNGALQHETKFTVTKATPRKEEPLQKKIMTPDRAYRQKGLEFLTPERMGGEDLRPSIFTTISLKNEQEDSEEES